MSARTPEQLAEIWHRLDAMAGQIGDPETAQQYRAVWRARFEREVSAAAPLAAERALATFTQADDGEYHWPDSEDDAERRLLFVLGQRLKLRRAQRALREQGNDLRSMEKAIGLSPSTITEICKSIEMDPEVREEKEMLLALYRRVAGVRGPMDEAILPQSLPVGVPKRLANGEGARAAKSATLALAWHDAGGL